MDNPTPNPTPTENSGNVTPTEGSVNEAPAPNPTDASANPQPNPAPVAPNTANEGDKTLTQDEANKIISERVNEAKESAVKGILDKFGFASSEELESAIGKAQAYEVMKEKSDNLEIENAELKSQNAMLEQNIEPNRYSDIKTYFKGLGKAVESESLKAEIGKHPEWLKQTSPIKVQMGTLPSPKPVLSEQEEAEKAFGFKFN